MIWTAFLAIAVGIIFRELRMRRALREARAAGDDLRLAVDTIPTIVWITEPDGTVTFMNRAWRDFTGLSLEDAADGRWIETLHPDEAEWVQATRNAAAAAGKAYELDARLRRADGSYRWVLRRAVPLRNERGDVVRWYGTGTDIDDLKGFQAKLRASEAYLAEAQRLSRTGSFGWDLSRAELRWSDETFRIFEYDPRSVTPTIEHVLQRVHREDLNAVREAIDRAAHEKQDWNLDHRLLMPDGRVKYVHIVARAATQPGGLEFIGAVMDVTAARRAQRAVRRARERSLTARFTAALKERTRLAREIHDTLLQGFTGVALQLTAMARRQTDPAMGAALRDIVGVAQRTLDEARQAVWDLREPVSPPESFAASLRQLAERGIASTNLTLDFVARGFERPLASRVQSVTTRVLQECIANVVRHASARSIRVRVSYQADGLKLSVSDDGSGFRLDPTFRAYGAHWGLLGMKERASELHGALAVRSAPGRGTTVVLRLPDLVRPAAVLA
jgi:PAS domain S-box-containing protein